MAALRRVPLRDLLARAYARFRGHHGRRQRRARQHSFNGEISTWRGSGTGVRRRAFVLPHAVVPAPRLREKVGSRSLRRRGRRRPRQDVDVARHVAAAGDLFGQGAQRGGAARAAPRGARQVLHRQFRQDRSSDRAMLNVDIRNGVARVTLDRPEVRNAFDDALIQKLQSSFEALGRDPSVRAVVLAGNGPAFCAGADLNWMKRMAGYGYDEDLPDAQALAAMLATLDRLPKPTIARVHGPVFAGGTGLVAACDIAVGTPEAKFCFSEAKLGLSPATISPYVMRAIGERMARRYFLTAEVFDAAEAYRIGMLSSLVPASDLDNEVDDLIKHLLAGGPEAHAKIKDLIRTVTHRPVDDALGAETAKRIAEIRVAPEGKEGSASCLEKRKASWCSPRS